MNRHACRLVGNQAKIILIQHLKLFPYRFNTRFTIRKKCQSKSISLPLNAPLAAQTQMKLLRHTYSFQQPLINRSFRVFGSSNDSAGCYFQPLSTSSPSSTTGSFSGSNTQRAFRAL
ncbi:hypothetical protein D3C78_1342090 [compost metagenome]